jgi:outer membrane autotransporter protein
MDRTYNTVFKNYVGNVNIFGKENKLTIDNSTLTSATYGISANGIGIAGEGNHVVELTKSAIYVQPYWIDKQYINADGTYQYAPLGSTGIGIYSSDNNVTLDDSMISLAANYSSGLYIAPSVNNGQGVFATVPKNNVINFNHSAIGTWGYFAPGVNITGSGNVVNYDMSSSVSHCIYSPAVISAQGASFNADNGSYFETKKDLSPGILVFDHGTADIKNSTIITAGMYSPNVLASTAPKGSAADNSIENKAVVENTKLTSSGAYSPGLLAYGYKSVADNTYYGSKIEAKNVDISTTGDWSPAVFAANNYDYTNGKVQAGELPGVDDANNTVVTVTGATIKTTGTDSSAVGAFLNGKVIINDATVTATGPHSAGVLVKEGGKVVLNNSTVISPENAVINTHTNGTVEANNSNITGYIRHEQEQQLRGLEVKFDGLTNIGTAVGFLGLGDITGGIDGNKILPAGYTDNLTIGDFNVNLQNSKWNMTADSDLGIGTYKANNSNIDMTASGIGNYETLTVDTMTGKNSTYVMDTDLASEVYGDKIYVKNTNSDAGVNYIQVYDKSLNSGTKVNAKDDWTKTKLLLVGGAGAGGTTWTGKTLDTGGLWETTPTIEKLGDNQWYLTMMKRSANPSTKTIMGSLDSAYGLWRYDDTLRKRLGDLRYIDNDQNGLWVRLKAGKMAADSYDGNYQMYQIGYDKKSDNTIYGIAVDHSKASNDYYAGDGDNSMTNLTLYATNYRGGVDVKNQKSGSTYSDLVLRAGRLQSNVDSYGTYHDSLGYDTWGYNISYEMGKTFRNDKGWFIEPEAQLSYGRLRVGDYTTQRGTHVHKDDIDSLLGRIGFVAGRKINDNKDFYFKANVYREFAGDGDMRFVHGDQTMLDDVANRDTWFEMGIGGNIRLADDTYMYGDVLKTFGADINKKWQVNLGLRWAFGGPKKEKAVAPAPVVVEPAPAPAPAPVRETYVDSVHFDFDVDTPKAEEMHKIDQFAKAAKANPDRTYAVVGNTDSVGTDAYNLALSQRRAENVKAEAEKRGVPAAQMQESYLGKAKPVESNDTDQGRAANRRVDIYEHQTDSSAQ